jgi:hypothetical protein
VVLSPNGAQRRHARVRVLLNRPQRTPPTGPTAHRVEFFRLPAPGKRDPHFGLSRGWYYKAAALGEIKMVAVRQRNALRGVRLVVYDSVVEYIRRAEKIDLPASASPARCLASSKPNLKVPMQVPANLHLSCIQPG